MRRTKLREVENELAETEDILRRMELEARSVPGATKHESMQRIKDYRYEK